jgi:hypothetical protein
MKSLTSAEKAKISRIKDKAVTFNQEGGLNKAAAMEQAIAEALRSKRPSGKTKKTSGKKGSKAKKGKANKSSGKKVSLLTKIFS